MNASPYPLLLVTGASKGIGKETALLAAKAGWTVAVHYHRDQKAAAEVLCQIKANGGAGILVSGDLSDPEEIKQIFEVLDAQDCQLGGLVNNAGLLMTQSRLDQMDWARINRVFSVNVLGSMLCAKEAVKRMSRRYQGQGGVIVNLSSAASRLGSAGEYVDYAASKGAIDSFTLGLAKEVAGEGIRVNALRPGIIDTQIHAQGGDPDRATKMAPTIPLQRPGQAIEVARAVLWLLSQDASYVTGALLDVAGGR